MWASVLKESLTVVVFVFIIMMLVDFLDVFSQQKLTYFLEKGRWRQYTSAALLGATPGCLGAFVVVSLYVHGRLTLGAVVACMVATAGDESFVMLAKIPGTAIWLTILLFFLGLIAGWLADNLFKKFNIAPAIKCCPVQTFHPELEKPSFTFNSLKNNFKHLSFRRFLLISLIIFVLYLFIGGRIGPSHWNWVRITFVILLFISFDIATFASEHYLEDHIWHHLIKKHLWRIFLWTFGALTFIKFGLSYFNLDLFIHQHLSLVLLISALVGIIPESGPHLVFVFLYAQGFVPFSVLFVSSIVQDGHGMLPLFSASLKDSLWIKLFNLLFSLLIGGSLYILGY
jgi:hypothetical protein